MEPLRLGKNGRHGTNPIGLGNVSVGMPAISPLSGPAMEIAHILFLDVVGYSKLRTTQQADVQRELQLRINAAGEVTQGRAQPGRLIIRPTGDGAALLFLRDMLSPLRCAIQLQTLMRHNDAEIRSRTGTSIQLRIGIHSGPVIITEDLNSQSDVAGEGINMAQRIMDCGDAGHILLSSDYAEKLRAIDPWPRYLQDVGECQVKHGIVVHLYNFYGKFDGIPCGMPGKPERLRAAEKVGTPTEKDHQRLVFQATVKKWSICSVAALLLFGGGYGIWNGNPDLRASVTKNVEQLAKPLQVANNDTKKDAKRPAGDKKKSRQVASRSSRPVEASMGPNLESVASSESFGDKVIVPKFLGLTFDEAANLAREHGIKLQTSDKSDYSLDYEEGQISNQSVPSGTVLKGNNPIYVRISKGEPPEPAQPTPDPAPATPKN